MLIGTAGHIDHGKTALIGRLTGRNTDRLPEEQRRGISIELGYAYVSLNSVGVGVGVGAGGGAGADVRAGAGNAGGAAGGNGSTAPAGGNGSTAPAGGSSAAMTGDGAAGIAGNSSAVVAAAAAAAATDGAGAVIDDEVIGFIDVPGHEKFVHTMVAGVTGIDLALLVIAADDGVMPQTEEHLDILRLLGVARGAIALTKTDRVPAARVASLCSDLAAMLGAPADGWPVFPLSNVTGQGVAELDAWLRAQARASRASSALTTSSTSMPTTPTQPSTSSTPSASSTSSTSAPMSSTTTSSTLASPSTSPTPMVLSTASMSSKPSMPSPSITGVLTAALPAAAARLAVDRVFTIDGVGTIVTGTLHSGRIVVGDEVMVQPAGIKARVRSLHAQDRAAPHGVAGQRCALNLAGISKAEVARGDWVQGQVQWVHQVHRNVRADLRKDPGIEHRHRAEDAIPVNGDDAAPAPASASASACASASASALASVSASASVSVSASASARASAPASIPATAPASASAAELAPASAPAPAPAPASTSASPSVATSVPLSNLSSRFQAAVQLSAREARGLGAWTSVHLHHGSRDVLARVSPLDAITLAPGQAGLVAISVQQPLPLCRGDRFVLRDAAAQRTLGGGCVLDLEPPARGARTAARLALLTALRDHPGLAALPAMLAAAPVRLDRLVHGWNTSVDALHRALVALDAQLAAGMVFSTERWAALRSAAVQAVADVHAQEPEMPGLEQNRLRRRVAPALPPEVIASLVDKLLAEGSLVRRGAFVALPAHRAELAPAEQERWARIAPLLVQRPFDPPRVRDVAKLISMDEAEVRTLLRKVARVGQVALVAQDHFFLSDAVAEMADKVAALIDAHGAARAADFRDQIGTGRKVAIQILEFFDRAGFTRRIGDDHVARGANPWRE